MENDLETVGILIIPVTIADFAVKKLGGALEVDDSAVEIDLKTVKIFYFAVGNGSAR